MISESSARILSRAPVLANDQASVVTHKPIYLDRGDLLRIHDGRGTHLIPASGVLWVTEEESANEGVLLPGDSHRIGSTGMALALAHRSGCVVLEVPAGTYPPRRVELVFAGGAPGHRIPVGTGRPSALVASMGVTFRNAIASARALWAERKLGLTEGRLAHDYAHPSRCIRHSRSGHGAPPSDDSPSSARDTMSREFPFPYY